MAEAMREPVDMRQVYDERRKESFKILHETASRQAQIEETIDYIDQRLAELNSERAELVQYQEVRTVRVCVGGCRERQGVV